MVEECINVVNEDIETLDDYSCSSRTSYIVLFIMFLLISVVIGSTFSYYYFSKSKDKVKKTRLYTSRLFSE